MLKQLRIQNIILIEDEMISFEPGFNVLSGETGSGKSAIMGALALITGERADPVMIRRGSEKGSVEAIIATEAIPFLDKILEEAGIDCDPSEDLIIRREISTSGKSRSFVNHQMAQMALLKQIGGCLIDIVGQHANQRLLSTDHHRNILDLYGMLQAQMAAFSASFAEENALRLELDSLIGSEAQRLRDIEICRMELEELDEAAVKEGEDEELFQEFTLLANGETLAQNVSEISCGLQQVLATLNKQKSSWEAIHKIDSSLTDVLNAHHTALIELQEVGYILDRYLARVEINPEKMAHMDRRLSLINKLKRKYGPSVAKINEYAVQTGEKLKMLENADSRIDQLRCLLHELEEKNNTLAEQLTRDRRQAAHQLQKAVIEQLHLLNMPKVEFEIEIQLQKRSKNGDDRVEFFLIPNLGEHRIPVKECASGGELSRLMLALQTLLAGKERTPIVVFDEIDSNIGGETANIIGEKLKTIGRKHQVLCVTHFPQVAKYADCHFQIAKQEVEGRTFTRIKQLDNTTKVAELHRMSGFTQKQITG